MLCTAANLHALPVRPRQLPGSFHQSSFRKHRISFLIRRFHLVYIIFSFFCLSPAGPEFFRKVLEALDQLVQAISFTSQLDSARYIHKHMNTPLNRNNPAIIALKEEFVKHPGPGWENLVRWPIVTRLLGPNPELKIFFGGLDSDDDD